MRKLCGKCRKEMGYIAKDKEWFCRCGFTSKEGVFIDPNYKKYGK